MHPFTSQRKQSVAALGEVRLIEAIRRWLGPATPPTPFGIGDDCAVLPRSKREQLVTVDPVIFGRHFDARLAPRDVGAKLLKRNLSDIAAMGGRPRAAVIALTLDARTKLAWVEGFYRGLAATARQFGVAIVGGDVAQADGTLAASLTLIGEATARRVLTRQGARIGDTIYVTGVLGNTLASGHHATFTPRLAEGAWLAAQRGVRAMMDVSDGLAKDLLALTPANAYPAIAATAIPLRAGATIRGALTDGEDYELLFVLEHRTDHGAFERAWHRRFPRLALSRLGEFVPTSLEGGAPSPPRHGKPSRRDRSAPRDAGDRRAPHIINLREYRGYEHLR